eukprot:222182-Amphidinium_carterae.1
MHNFPSLIDGLLNAQQELTKCRDNELHLVQRTEYISFVSSIVVVTTKTIDQLMHSMPQQEAKTASSLNNVSTQSAPPDKKTIILDIRTGLMRKTKKANG